MAVDQETYDWVDNVCSLAQTNDDKLTDWENNFVNDFTEKLEKYKLRLNITAKQYEILKRIEGKCNG